MLVIVNPTAGGGTALAKWHELAPLLRPYIDSRRAVAVEAHGVRDLVQAALAQGERRFVAAGGDGTVNLVLSALVDGGTAPRARASRGDRPRLGAVGLGSSNDFHKPVRKQNLIAGVPVRLDFSHTVFHDVGVLEYADETGSVRRRPWLLNASIGVTAEANRFFNGPDPLLRVLKRLVPALAMVYAAVRGLVRRRARRMELAIDGAPPVTVPVTNLGVVKNPHFTGALRYDSPYEPGSGAFHVHLLDDPRLAKVLVALWGLSRGRFMQRGIGRSWRAKRLTVRAGEPFAVECDGEVITTRDASFFLLPRRIAVCG